MTLTDPTTTPTNLPPGAPQQYKYEILSRNVLRIDIPKEAQPIDTGVMLPVPQQTTTPTTTSTKTVETTQTTGKDKQTTKTGENKQTTDSTTTKTVEASTTPKSTQTKTDAKGCKPRKVIDVHVATSNGVSNHLFVEVPANFSPEQQAKPITTSVTTTTAIDSTTGKTTTKTDYQTTPPGIVLPPGTILPMGSGIPAGGTFVAPGGGTINVNPSGYQPGTVPSNFYQPMPANPAPTPSASPSGGTSMQTDPVPAYEGLASRAPTADPAPAREIVAPALAPTSTTVPSVTLAPGPFFAPQAQAPSPSFLLIFRQILNPFGVKALCKAKCYPNS